MRLRYLTSMASTAFAVPEVAAIANASAIPGGHENSNGYPHAGSSAHLARKLEAIQIVDDAGTALFAAMKHR